MEWIFFEFREACAAASGPRLSKTLLPPSQASDPSVLDAFYQAFDEHSVENKLYRMFQGHGKFGLSIKHEEALAWTEVYTAFWHFLGTAITAINDSRVRRRQYHSWKEMTNALIKNFSSGSFESWSLPCLYVAGRWLRMFAIEADQEEHEKGKDVARIDTASSDDIVATMAKNDNLEDAARVLNRMFTICITDRAPMIDSRKWGLYYITNLLFKTYFKLNSVSLCKNPYRALQASHLDMPPVEAFPRAHICTFKYYVGLMFFLEEDYNAAEQNLLEAYQQCHSSAQKNMELILTYLIPCRLVTARELPQPTILQPYPRLQRLLLPVCQAIRQGHLSKFDKALSIGEPEFVRSRIYLTLERGRDVCLRNLFRKVFIEGAFEDVVGKDGRSELIRRTRIPIDEFVLALKCSIGDPAGGVGRDEVECMLANLIFKTQSLVKGYIARERGIVVLSKGNAFPGTGV